jgi:hypothetical protein
LRDVIPTGVRDLRGENLAYSRCEWKIVVEAR